MSFKSEATILKTSEYIWWEFKDLEAYNQLEAKKSLNIPGFSCLYFMARGHCVKNARMRVISEPYTGM